MLCVLVTGCFPFHATTRMGVSGTVLDAETHAPLADAQISFCGGCSNTQPVAISTADGSFTLPRQKQWQLGFINEDSFLALFMGGGTVCIQHNGYETNQTDVFSMDDKQRYHTKTNLGFVLLKPLR